MSISPEDASMPAKAIAELNVAGRYRLEIVYPAGVSAESDPVSDAYRHGLAGSLSPLVEVAEAVLQPGDRVLDLGAHLGGFALTAAAMGCEVIAVEASAELADCLVESARRSGRSRLRVVQAAIGDVNGTVEFSALGPFGHVAAAATGHPARAVPARRVDDLLAEHGWDTLHFVKLDVEGSELRALAGMRQWLERPDAPVVFFESNKHTLALYQQDDVALRQAFVGAGYRVYRIPGVGRLEAIDESHVQVDVCCDYLAIKPPVPPRLRSWLADFGATSDAPAQQIDWIGRVDSLPPLPGFDRLRHVFSSYADWSTYLATLAHRPLPTVLLIDLAPPPDVEPFLSWFAHRGVLLGASSALLRQSPDAPRWMADLRLLLTDAQPLRIAGLPAGARMDCLGEGALPEVADGCRVEAVAGIDAALEQQRLRIRIEQSLWEREAPPAAVAPVLSTATPEPLIHTPAAVVEDRREQWLKRALRLTRIPVIGPLLSWGWAVRDLVGTRRKVLRFEERFAALIETQAMADRDVKALAAWLGRLEASQGETGQRVQDLGLRLADLQQAQAESNGRLAGVQQAQAESNERLAGVQQLAEALRADLVAVRVQSDTFLEHWNRDFLAPGTELPFTFQRPIPDQLELARAGLDLQQPPAPEDLVDPEVSQMWLGELAGPDKRAILTRQYDEYWPWIAAVDGPVLDVGCGAGQWLDFLAGHDKAAIGIDSNRHEVERCRRNGRGAHVADAFDWLAAHPAEYGAITLFQVIEHIPRGRLQEFLGLLAAALRRGGLLLLETVNPAHPLALSVFYNDPTHQRPLPVEYLGFLCQGAGLRPEATLYNYPVSVAVTGAGMQAMHYLNYTLVLRRP